MKLRNKKTGEIVEYDKIGFRKSLSDGWKDFVPKAESIAEFNENWEDYNPTDPLIKDERIRKAVRAWARLNELDEIEVEPPTIDCSIISFGYGMLRIDFYLGKSDISDGTYAIAELCGEEE